MDHQVLQETPLLTKKGTLTEIGWAKEPLFLYDRNAIKAPFYRIKEWDYYAIINPKLHYAIAVTVSDLGYASLFCITFVDYNLKKSVQCDSIKLLSCHKTGLAPSSDIDNEVSFMNEKMTIAFVKKANKRHLLFTAPSLVLPSGKIGLKCELTLLQAQKHESINIATSWAEKPTAFYLNQKVVGMPVSGIVRLGDEKHELDKGEAFGILDWGRGRWTYKNRWYWASAAGMINGTPLGFNLGYGFTDRSQATENAIFVNYKLYKIHNITFDIPKNYLKPWHMLDDEGKVDLNFLPIAPRTSLMKMGPILSDQKQYFGIYNGVLHLEDNLEIKVKNLFGFAEDVYNKY